MGLEEDDGLEKEKLGVKRLERASEPIDKPQADASGRHRDRALRSRKSTDSGARKKKSSPTLSTIKG